MILHFLRFFYWGQPWYAGNVYGNVFVIAVLAPLGWLWAKTKWWPLKPIRHGISALHAKVDHTHARLDQLHARHDQHERNHAELLAAVTALHDKLDDKA